MKHVSAASTQAFLPPNSEGAARRQPLLSQSPLHHRGERSSVQSANDKNAESILAHRAARHGRKLFRHRVCARLTLGEITVRGGG